MIPAACPAHLDHVNREFLSGLGQAYQLFRAARGTRDRPEAVAVDPGYEGELFLPADRACDLAPPAVKFGRTQQVGISVTYLGDIDTARIDVSQQRLAPERIVDHLPLNSHAPRVAVMYLRRPRLHRIRSLDIGAGARAREPGRTSRGPRHIRTVGDFPVTAARVSPVAGRLQFRAADRGDHRLAHLGHRNTGFHMTAGV